LIDNKQSHAGGFCKVIGSNLRNRSSVILILNECFAHKAKASDREYHANSNVIRESARMAPTWERWAPAQRSQVARSRLRGAGGGDQGFLPERKIAFDVLLFGVSDH